MRHENPTICLPGISIGATSGVGGYPKFTATQANPLIIADDLNLSLHDTLFQVEGALYGAKWQYGEGGYFTSNRFEHLGGLGVFYAFSAVPSRGIEYQFVIYENPHALPATKLPQSLLEQFIDFAEEELHERAPAGRARKLSLVPVPRLFAVVLQRVQAGLGAQVELATPPTIPFIAILLTLSALACADLCLSRCT